MSTEKKSYFGTCVGSYPTGELDEVHVYVRKYADGKPWVQMIHHWAESPNHTKEPSRNRIVMPADVFLFFLDNLDRLKAEIPKAIEMLDGQSEVDPDEIHNSSPSE